jgi:hypothetical protein
MFNQRKLVIVISDKSDVIAQGIIEKLQRGVTFLYGRGGCTGKPKKVMLTVVNNYQLKRLKETVFGIDANYYFDLSINFYKHKHVINIYVVVHILQHLAGFFKAAQLKLRCKYDRGNTSNYIGCRRICRLEHRC